MQKENELQQEIEQLEKLTASGDISVGGLQQKQRFINILNKQIEQKQNNTTEKQIELNTLKLNTDSINERLRKVYDHYIK